MYQSRVIQVETGVTQDDSRASILADDTTITADSTAYTADYVGTQAGGGRIIYSGGSSRTIN